MEEKEGKMEGGTKINFYPIHFYGKEWGKEGERENQYVYREENRKLYQYIGDKWKEIEIERDYFYFEEKEGELEKGHIYYISKEDKVDVSYEEGKEIYGEGDVIIDMINGHFLIYKGGGMWQIKWSVFLKSLIPNPELSFSYLSRLVTISKYDRSRIGFGISDVKIVSFKLHHR